MPTRDPKWQIFANLNGGLATRPSPLMVEAGSQVKMKSPQIRNVDYFPLGSLAKRNGKTKQGDSVASSIAISQTSSDGDFSYGAGTTAAYFGQKITTVGAISVNQIDVYLASSFTGVGFTTVNLYIYSNSAGSPGTLVATSSTTITLTSSTTTTLQSFYFSTPASLSGATDYWIVIGTSNSLSRTDYIKKNGAGSSGRVKASTNLVAWVAQVPNDFYYIVYFTGTANAINGLYDYRFGNSQTQKIMAAAGGAIYYKNGSSWTSIVTGLATGQDNIYDMTSLNNYLFTMDYATNPGRVWDGTQSYTIKLGYQAAFTLTDSAAAGTLPAGVYKVMAVTQLISGGYRASFASVTVGGASNHQIAVSAIAMNGSGATDFGFDINATATTWFMTDTNGSTYYKIPAANMGGSNPYANSTTSFNITANTGLTAANTLLDAYTLDQPYFTSQVAAPVGKYFAVFQNMLVVSGATSTPSGTNPSRVWFSSKNEPMIWSTVGGVEGNYFDIDPNDGDVVTGLKVFNGNLFIFKNHSVWVTEYTGNANAPFTPPRKLNSNIGALSHWSIKEANGQLLFMSERGPALVAGTSAVTLPATTAILDHFDPNNTGRYNLAAMKYTTCGINSTKQQIWWGVSSTSATTRDLTLVYDFENEAFYEHDLSANFYTEISDSNNFRTVWSGDYSAQVFQNDNGTSDNGSAINFYFYTPWITFQNPFDWNKFQHLWISGAKQSSGTLYVDIYYDFGTSITQTVTFDMTTLDFTAGKLRIPLSGTAHAVQLVIRNSELNVPVQINAIGVSFTELGTRA